MKARSIILSILAILMAGGCAARNATQSADGSPESPALIAAYLSGTAGTHHCACGRWPTSWAELKQFDDRLHELSRSQGQEPVMRVPWSRLEQSGIEGDSLGGLIIKLRISEPAETLSVTAKVPDCSAFNREEMSHLCGTGQED